jgi:transposase
MARPSKKTPDQKLQIVLAVLRGELSAMCQRPLTAMDAARRNGVSEQSVHNWKRLFLESGRQGLEKGARRPSSREMELEAENEELKAALGEAHVQLRVWRRVRSTSPFEDLEMIRQDAQLTVSRFAELIGMPRRTYHYRLANLRLTSR